MISKTVLHAIKALVALSKLPDEQYAGAATIASAIGAPKNYLGKLLQVLSHEGLVCSQKGLGGGFRLARAPKEISLIDIVEPIESVGQWSDCFLGQGSCSDEDPCPLHHEWKIARDAYLNLLTNTTIEDLARQHGAEIEIGANRLAEEDVKKEFFALS